jgi:hypothetical protein
VRDFIISEIKRLASDNGGVAPGKGAFARATGITEAKWRGVYWVKWSDAVEEAGFAPNTWNQKLDTRSVLTSVAELCRRLGRMPTHAEIKMERRSTHDFPALPTVLNHFPTKRELTGALRHLGASDPKWSSLLQIVSEERVGEPISKTPGAAEGMVYLLKSGGHYKIGRSDDIERRFREVTIALPEAVTLIHTIRTDDPSGIEAYWHRRFAEKRANGEWFALSGDDVRAFRKRTFQ